MPYVNIFARHDSAADQELFKEKGGRGFPFVTLMTADGDVIWEFRPTDKDAFDHAHKWASKLPAAKAKAAAKPDDKILEANAILLDSIGRSQRKQVKTDDELVALSKLDGIDAEILKAFKPKVLEMAMGKARQDGGKAAFELFKAGERPSADQELPFYYHCARAAMAAKDVDNATKLVDLFAAAGAKNERFKERVLEDAAKMREQIKSMTAPAK